MPSQQLKRIFVGGLDTDTDPRLLKNGDYHYALNIRNMSSESNTVGVVENIKSNTSVPYTFPDLVSKCTPQRTILFIPSSNYYSNYTDWDGDIPESYEYVFATNPELFFNGQLIDNPISIYDEQTELGSYVSNFSIGLTNSLSNVNNPEIQATIEYEGSTTENQLYYLTNFVNTYGSMFAGMGVTVSVIDNNNQYWNDSDWFPNPENITNHPNYTPGQVHAYALMFEGSCSVSVEQFFINLFYSGGNQVQVYNGPYGDSDQLEVSENNFPTLSWDIVDWANKNYMEGSPTAITTPGVHPVITPVNYSCIGYYEDTKKDKIYYMIASDPDAGLHHILEYDLQTNIITTVFRDCGDPGTSVFSWRHEFLINDIDKVGDVLYWTSRQYGEPCSINVEKSKASMFLINNLEVGNYFVSEQGVDSEYSLKNYYPYQLYDQDYPKEKKRQYIEVIKRPPLDYPTYTYSTDSNFKKNNLYGHMWQFKYRYHFYDKEVSAWSPISDIVTPSTAMANIAQQNNQSADNKITVTVKNSSGIVEFIELAVLKCKDIGNFPKGNRGNFKSVRKIKNDYGAWLVSNESTQTISFYNDQMYTHIDSLESTKLFDNVPRSANTQTILSNNRLAYGNYTEGFDVPLINTELKTQYGYISNPASLSGDEGQSDILYPYWTTNNNSLENDLAYELGALNNEDNSSSLTINSLENTNDENMVGSWWGADPLGLGNPLGVDSNNNDIIDTIPSDSLANITFNSHSLHTVDSSSNVAISETNPAAIESSLDNPLGNGVFTGSHAGTSQQFPRVRLLFNFDTIVWGDAATITFNFDWKFKVRREFNDGSVVKFADSQEHVCRFYYTVQTLAGETDVATQMNHVAEKLRAAVNPVTLGEIPSYNSELDIDGIGTNKPEQTNDYDFSWHKRPIVSGTTLILEWVAPKKNVFPDMNDVSLVGYTYRMISSNGGNAPGYSFLINKPANAGDNNNFQNIATLNYSTMPYNSYGGGVNSVSSFKSGAFHNFGLVYYDEKGRCSTVLVDSVESANTPTSYVKFPPERTNADVELENDVIEGANIDINGPVTIMWKIKHQAPDWASHYRWFYSRNNTVNEFVQFRALKAYVNQSDAVDDDRIYISLAGLKGRADSYIPNDAVTEEGVPNPDVNIWNYKFSKGDRVRFVTTGSQNTLNPGQEQSDLIADQYVDVNVSAFNYYNAFDESAPIQNAQELNTLAADGSEDGHFLVIHEVKDSAGVVVPGYSKQDVINGTDNFKQVVLEIYRPREETSPEETLYYEFGKKYEIDKNSKTHKGPMVDQGGSWVTDYFGNTISAQPAVGQFTTGDIYYKPRVMQQVTGNNISFNVEDYYLNDYQETNHFSIGRSNLYSVNYKESNREASITYSDVYQPDTSFNGLSSFNLSLFNWEDYHRIEGSIQKIESRDTDLVMIQEDKTYSIPVEKDVMFNAKGEANVALSNKILGKPRPLFLHNGISKNPESFVVNGNVMYWTDIKRGVVLRLSRDGFTVLSDVAMSDYFRDRSHDYEMLDPEYNWSDDYGNITGSMLQGEHKRFRIKGGWNPKHGEYIVQFPDILQNQSDWAYLNEVFEGTDEEWEEWVGDIKTLVKGSVVAWGEKQKRWVTFYSHVADYYGKINRKFVSWKEGGLYIHDQGTGYNNFYGDTQATKLDFYFNKGPSTVKGYKAITLESTLPLFVDLETDLCSTSIHRDNFDEREGKLYTQIPFVTGGGVGGDLLGIGRASSVFDEDTGELTATLNGEGVTNYYNDSQWTQQNIALGDELFYFSGVDGDPVRFVGAIEEIASDTELSVAEVPTFIDNEGQEQPLAFAYGYLYIQKPAHAEGDRMKGRYMETKLSRTTGALIEIFSVGTTVFNSELSDD